VILRRTVLSLLLQPLRDLRERQQWARMDKLGHRRAYRRKRLNNAD
jgi:hypothetical protein